MQENQRELDAWLHESTKPVYVCMHIMQDPSPHEGQDNQSLHCKQVYTAEGVMLKTLFTDSTGSEDEQSSNVDFDSEFDLSDPEAGVCSSNNEFDACQNVTSSNELFASNCLIFEICSGDDNAEQNTEVTSEFSSTCQDGESIEQM